MRKFLTPLLVLVICSACAQKRRSTNAFAPSPVQIDAGTEFACALVNGQLWYWGDRYGAWVDTTNRYAYPLQLAPDKKWKAIACNGNDLVALDENGTAWAWGRGNWASNSTLGTGVPGVAEQYASRKFPFKLFENIQWASIAVSTYFFSGIKQDGTLWVAGQDDCRIFGSFFQATLAQLGKEQSWAKVVLGNMHGAAVTKDNALWTWGQNGYAQLGLGKPVTHRLDIDCHTLQQVAAGKTWKAIAVSTSNAIAIHEDGSLWSWGDLAYNVFRPEYTLVPTRLGGDARWISASTGESHALAVREDGSLWAIGSNENGQLGNGTTNRAHELTRIGNENNWAQVKAASLGMSLAVKKDGTIWAWGNNEMGQVGDGTRIDKHTPQQVILKAR